jgi:hypothetical protein
MWSCDTLIDLKSNYCNYRGDHEKVYSLHPLQIDGTILVMRINVSMLSMKINHWITDH